MMDDEPICRCGHDESSHQEMGLCTWCSCSGFASAEDDGFGPDEDQEVEPLNFDEDA